MNSSLSSHRKIHSLNLLRFLGALKIADQHKIFNSQKSRDEKWSFLFPKNYYFYPFIFD